MSATGSGAWQTIGGAMESLVAAGDNIYGLDAGGTLYLYSGTPMQWTRIGSGFAQVATWGVLLYGLKADKSAVLSYDADLETWVAVAGPTGAITAGDFWIAGLQDGKVSVRTFGSDAWPGETSESPDELADTMADTVTVTDRPSVTGNKWMIRLRMANTATQSHGFYNGKIRISINSGSYYKSVPVQAFANSGEYSFSADFTSDVISTLTIWVFAHRLPNTLTLGTITAWNINTGILYSFDVNRPIPSGSQRLTLTPSSTTNSPVHKGPAVVYVWRAGDYWNLEVGHAAMELSDGTYISWWPTGEITDDVAMWPKPFTSLHDPNRTYADDLAGEGNQPPEVVIPLWNLNEAAIKSWWAVYDGNPQNLYILLTANCSTTVFQALWNGGALDVLDTEEKAEWAAVPVWTPMLVENLMIRLQEKALPS